METCISCLGAAFTRVRLPDVKHSSCEASPVPCQAARLLPEKQLVDSSDSSDMQAQAPLRQRL